MSPNVEKAKELLSSLTEAIYAISTGHGTEEHRHIIKTKEDELLEIITKLELKDLKITEKPSFKGVF